MENTKIVKDIINRLESGLSYKFLKLIQSVTGNFTPNQHINFNQDIIESLRQKLKLESLAKLQFILSYQEWIYSELSDSDKKQISNYFFCRGINYQILNQPNKINNKIDNNSSWCDDESDVLLCVQFSRLPSNMIVSDLFCKMFIDLFQDKSIITKKITTFDRVFCLFSFACWNQIWEVLGYNDPFMQAQQILLKKGFILKKERNVTNDGYNIICDIIDKKIVPSTKFENIKQKTVYIK